MWNSRDNLLKFTADINSYTLLHVLQMSIDTFKILLFIQYTTKFAIELSREMQLKALDNSSTTLQLQIFCVEILYIPQSIVLKHTGYYSFSR